MSRSHRMLPKGLCLVLSIALSWSDTVDPEDVGYEKMWQDSTEPTDWDCWAQPQLPAWLNGSFILPSVAQFSLGGLEFQGVLDGFGKLHRFQLSEGKLCFRAKMMRTNFYNRSLDTGTVAPSMLFEETKPARKNCHLPTCNLRGANDNTYVNTIELGGEFSTWTDSTVANALNPFTLEVLGGYDWKDNLLKKHPGHVAALGSAHPLRREQGKGDLVAIQISPPMIENVGLGSFVDIVTISDADPHTRKLLTTSTKLPMTPYFHSFGITEEYVVLPFTPMVFDILPGMLNKPMEDSFRQAKPMSSTFVAYPFDGGEPISFQTDDAFTCNHLVNSYQNDTGIVFDVNSFSDARVWIIDGPAHKSVQINKTARDALKNTPGMQQIWRYVLHLNGAQKGPVSSELLGTAGRVTEFPKINPKFSGVKYCVYYAQEWYHNDQEFASMAILKHNICNRTKEYWYRPSTYPSEPFFIPQPAGEHEQDGVVVFSITDGVSGVSSLVVLDNDMKTLVEQPLPTRITFSTHGEWFEGLVGRDRPQ